MTELVGKILPGIGEMANIHPLLVHFPIAFLNGFLLLELLGLLLKKDALTDAAAWMLYLGTAGAAAAVGTGLWAATTVRHSEETHAIMERHEYLGITVLVLALLLTIWRIYVHGRFSFKARALHLFISFIMVATMTFGADLGGIMVYKYGVAVQETPVHTSPAAGGIEALDPPYSSPHIH